MKHANTVAVSLLLVVGLASCAAEKDVAALAVQEVEIDTTAPTVSFKPGDEFSTTTAKPGAPYTIGYRIIGTPIVGSPVTIDLRVRSTLGPRPVTISYRINDASAMMLADSQPDSVYLEPAANESEFTQQVTIIPQRNGRLYLNVSASFQTDDGTMSTASAIPIQVGTGTRELTDNGTLSVDENGDAVRVLTSE